MSDYYQSSTPTDTANQQDQNSDVENSGDQQTVTENQGTPPDPTEGGFQEETQTNDPAPTDATPSYDGMVEQLIRQLGFENVSEPQKSQLVNSIKQRIETRVLRVLMTSLTEEQTQKVEERIKQEGLDEKAIIDLLVNEAPNASAAVVSALDDLYMEMKEETDLIMKSAGAKVAEDAEAAAQATE